MAEEHHHREGEKIFIVFLFEPDREFIQVNPSPAEPGYALPLQTV